MTVTNIRRDLRQITNPARARITQCFFKTGPGEYAEGDRFLGLTVPQLRVLAKRYWGLPLHDIATLLRSPIHEERLLALLLLVQAYRDGDADEQHRIYTVYLRSTKFINNWDLVDCSAEHIVGAFLAGRNVRRRSPTAPCLDRRSPDGRRDLRSIGVARSGDRPQQLLVRLARSDSLWERRIAIIATFHFIKRGEFGPTLWIARLLLRDEHDLIHKAVGWMLREVGKRDVAVEEKFLRQHYRQMPRTMLRYAIELLPEGRRRCYLKGTIN